MLPFFHFYHGAEGRVEAFSCTISKLQRFKVGARLSWLQAGGRAGVGQLCVLPRVTSPGEGRGHVAAIWAAQPLGASACLLGGRAV